MKTLLKKLTAAVVIGMLAVMPILAVDQSFTLQNSASGTGLYTNLVSGGAEVYSISFVNGATIAVNYAIIDGPATNSTYGPAQGYTHVGYSNAAYIGYTSYLTNITKTITNFSGLTTNFTVTNVMYTVSNSVPAFTNLYRVIAAGQVAASTTVTIPIAEGATVHFARGINFTNSASTNSSIRINYAPAL